MRKSIFAALLALALLPPAAVAHEGHHDAPGAVQAPKGGQIKTLETIHLEPLTEGKTARIYVYDLNLKPADAAKYPVTGSVTLPKKKAEPITLETKGDHWAFEYDAKKAHRYTFELSIKQGGHDDKIKWTIEPKHKH